MITTAFGYQFVGNNRPRSRLGEPMWLFALLLPYVMEPVIRGNRRTDLAAI